jgi:hypothetical protein
MPHDATQALGMSKKKLWSPPALRKLPITATAGMTKADFNEGVGKGKGNSGDSPSS